jgi:hypothetical protein
VFVVVEVLGFADGCKRQAGSFHCLRKIARTSVRDALADGPEQSRPVRDALVVGG